MKKTFFLLIWILLGSACTKPSSLFTRSRLVMGHVPLNIQIKILSQDKEKALQATEKAYEIEKELEAKISEYNPESEVSCLNRNAGKNFCKLSAETLWILNKALELQEQTGGAFDIRFASPSSKGRHGKILIKTDSALLDDPETRIGLGSLGKGFILDRMLDFLKSQGFASVILDAGGDILAGEGKWKVKIQIPGHAYGKNTKGFWISEEALTTSSNHENKNNVWNPHTGKAVEEKSSVSVKAKSAALANALSTSFYVLGEQKSREILKRFPQAQMIWVNERGGLKQYP